jgi:hypothetical protein
MHSSIDKNVAGGSFHTHPPQTHPSLQSFEKSFISSPVCCPCTTSLWQDTHTRNNMTIAATSVTSYYATLSPPSLVMLKLHPHFLKQFTLFINVTQHNESVKSAITTFTFVPAVSWHTLSSMLTVLLTSSCSHNVSITTLFTSKAPG